jgi:rare lipoprotein A
MRKRFYGYLTLSAMVFWLASCASPVTRSLGTEEGLASYYSSEFQGKKTSSGEPFDKNKLTAAHRSYPFGTIVKVTNLKNGKDVQVRVNDRGPVKPERIIDLSYAAAEEIGLIKLGLVRVKLEVLEWGEGK